MKKVAEYERQELRDWLESIVNSASPEARDFTAESAQKVIEIFDSYAERETEVVELLRMKRPHNEIVEIMEEGS